MFQTYTRPFAAMSVSLCLILLPATSYAGEQSVSVKQTEITLSDTTAQTQTSRLKDISFRDIRHETKTKFTKTKRWVKAKKIDRNIDNFVDDVEKATNRLQKQVSPAGRSIKSFFGDKIPGKTLVERGDRTVTVYGLILIMAFCFVLLMMGLANPSSRLGGRH